MLYQYRYQYWFDFLQNGQSFVTMGFATAGLCTGSGLIVVESSVSSVMIIFNFQN